MDGGVCRSSVAELLENVENWKDNRWVRILLPDIANGGAISIANLSG